MINEKDKMEQHYEMETIKFNGGSVWKDKENNFFYLIIENEEELKKEKAKFFSFLKKIDGIQKVVIVGKKNHKPESIKFVTEIKKELLKKQIK